MGQVIQLDNHRPLPGVRVRYVSGEEKRLSAVCAEGLCEFCEVDWCECDALRCHRRFDDGI